MRSAPVKVLSRKTLLIPLSLVAALFVASSVVVYHKFRTEFTSAELSNQQKMTRIIHQSLNLYFEKLRFITENAVLQNAFKPELTSSEDELRHSRLQDTRIIDDFSKLGIKEYLEGPRKGDVPEVVEI